MRKHRPGRVATKGTQSDIQPLQLERHRSTETRITESPILSLAKLVRKLTTRAKTPREQGACPFLDKAPLEIRYEIYTYLPSTRYTKRPAENWQKNWRATRGCKSDYLYHFQPAILLANKQVYNEAHRFLYHDNNFVLVRYPHNQGSDLDLLRIPQLTLVPVTEDQCPCGWPIQHVSLQIDLNSRDYPTSRSESQYVIAPDELPLFFKTLECDMNFYPGFLADDLEMVLTISSSHQLNTLGSMTVDPVGWSPQSLTQKRILLEPFTMLHSIRTFTVAAVEGKSDDTDARLIEALKKRVSRSPATFEEDAVEAPKIEHRGNEAFDAGNFWLAHSLYKLAEEDMGRSLRRKNRRPYFEMLYRIKDNWMAALIRTEQWKAACDQAKELIMHLEYYEDDDVGIPMQPGEMAELYRQKTLAREGLEKQRRDEKENREAIGQNPYNRMLMARKWEWMMKEKFAKTMLDQAALEALTIRMKDCGWWTQLVDAARGSAKS